MLDPLTPEQLAVLRERGAEIMASIRYIIIHCSATRCTHDYTAQQLERDHIKRGFRTVGYHYYIRRDGTLTQHRHLLTPGAHCRPYNHCSIGICYEGGLDADGKPCDTRTEWQRQRMDDLVEGLRQIFPDAVVCGHLDMPGATPKDCPCFNAMKEYAR